MPHNPEQSAQEKQEMYFSQWTQYLGNLIKHSNIVLGIDSGVSTSTTAIQTIKFNEESQAWEVLDQTIIEE